MNKIKNIVVIFALVILGNLVTTSSVSAYAFIGHKWQNPNVTYKINTTNPYNLESNALISTIQSATRPWHDQGSQNVNYIYGGTTNANSLSLDYSNNVFFRNDATQTYGAMMYWWGDGQGKMLDIDIVVNTTNGRTFHLPGDTTCTTNGIYVDNILTHEFGHGLGLTHSSVAGATMVPQMSSWCDTTWTTLEDDDISGIQALYGNTTPPPGVAHINVSPTSLSFSAETGVTPSGKTLNISNSGTATLNWSASANQSWCRVSPASGSIAVGSNANTVVGLDSVSSAGSYSCTVTVSGQADNSPRTVGVNYTVTQSPTSGTPSPECTTANTITDSSGAVWTIGPNLETLRNGVQVAGYGSVYLYTSQTVYVLGTDSNWWKWTGSSWTSVGSTKPSCQGTNPPPPTGETNPPTVSITSPVTGGTVAKKGSVTITANATDDTGVTKVLFYVGTTLTCTDTSAPYSCSWKVPASPNKAYSLQAKGYDAAGNIGTSNTVNVVAK